MKNVLSILLLLLVLIASCKKEKASSDLPPSAVKFSAEALAYVKLPVEKYFIYKDSATGRLDSVIVKESTLRTTDVPKYNCPSSTNLFSFCTSHAAYNYEIFTLKLVKFNGSLQEDWYYETANSVPIGSWIVIATDTAMLYFSGTFWYPVTYIQSRYATAYFHSSFLVEGKSFTNVLQFINTNHDNIGDPSYKKTVYYWAKGIGIIKREVKTFNSIKTDLLVRHG
jgi:hypothetical protein